MRILGIDPGTTAVGFAVIETAPRTATLCASGILLVRSRAPAEQLKEIHTELQALIQTWRPEVAAIEKLFFAKNTKTAIAVSQARGALLLTTVLAGLTVYEYTPLEIKKIITGDGKADKLQVKKMVQLTLPETKILRARDDVFDAIATALACFYNERNVTQQFKVTI